MKENDLLLSICIPTCKRPEIIDNLLESILSQGINENIYEICITDNSKTDETEKLIKDKYFNVLNLHYKRTTCEGFLNSVEALHYGQGKYIKLHNDYSFFYPGSLNKMINQIQEAEKNGAYIYFSFGAIKSAYNISSFKNFNDFAKYISYQATWSSAFGIWKTELEKIDRDGITPNYMFPHTSYLHRLTAYNNYIVDNYKYTYSAELQKKGGYNLIDNFVRIYLTMVKEDILKQKYITNDTYKIIESDILKFAAEWFFIVKHNSEKYTFTFDNDENIVRSTCGELGLKRYKKNKRIISARYVIFLGPIRKMLKSIIKISKNS